MIAAGLSPVQAKKLKKNLEAKTAAIHVVAKKVAAKLNDVLDGQQAPVVAERRPSAEGLSRDLHGDLIGVARDDIFKMINRRYKRKSEMNWFYGP